ncbi:MAG: right-handed parallel beta-helix repeat-containing protein [Phycisphaerales bacterium]
MNTSTTRFSRFAPITVAALIAFAGFVVAGPLNPPTGPVTSTGKTMTEVEPRIAINATNTPGGVNYTYYINKPGSYYLTGNIIGEAGKDGIGIETSGVTIDLNGFEVVGVNGSHNGIFFVANSASDFVLRNGTVRNWGQNGVNTATYSPQGVEIIGVHANNNALSGIIAAHRARILDCEAKGNTSRGIYAGDRSVIEGCSVWNNGGLGIETAGHCVIRRCEARGNGAAGILTNTFATISDCLAFENTNSGINAAAQSVIENCTASMNQSIGILAAAACTVRNNHVSNNDIDGIRVTSQCVVTGNSSNNNGVNSTVGAGIHATLADNRIEGNNCGFQDIGFDIDVAGNFLSRNTATNNTANWSVVAGNKCLVVLGVNCANIQGDAGGVSPGSTDPNANFTY